MKLFELYADLKLDIQDFDRGISSATKSGENLAKSLGADADSIKAAFTNAFSFSVGQLMAEGFQDGLGFLKDFTSESIKAASDLEEVRNVIDVTFGEDAADIYAWAKNAKNAFGMSELAALDYAGQMGSVLKVQEFATDDVRDMSKAIVELAADYASFKNLDFSETFGMLRSGLRGETESIEQLGLTVHVGTLVDYLGLEKETEFTKGMSQAEQIMARYNYIMDKSSFVQGDFARTSNSFANELRILNTNIVELQSNLGDKLLPVANSFLQFLNFFFEDTKTADEAVGDIQKTFTETYASIETTTANALELVNALKELEEGGVTGEEESAWSKLVNELLTDIPALGEKIPNTTAALTAGTDALKAYIQEWRDLQMEAGRNKVLEDYYTFLGEKQAAYAKEKTEYDNLTLEAEAGEKLYTQTWTDALNYLQDAYGEDRLTADEIMTLISTESRRKTALQSLYAMGNRGDSGADAYYDVLSELDTPEDLSRQLALAANEMDKALLDMREAESRKDVITAAIDALNEPDDESNEALSSTIRDSSNNIIAAMNKEDPTINVNVSVNGNMASLVTAVSSALARGARAAVIGP